MKFRILLIEDDLNLARSIQEYLQREGFEVVTTSEVMDLERLQKDSIDLILLDWMLQSGPSIDWLIELRSQKLKFPVLFLTARAELLDKVVGLEAGADDYLTKPFEPRELLARIRARLRNHKTETEISIRRSGPLQLDTEKREASYEGRSLDLTRLEFELLALLSQSPGRVFTRESLLNQVWGFENFPTTRTVDNHVLTLRQKTRPEQIETIRGIGYRWVEQKL